MALSMQFSLYPLRQDRLGPTIEEALAVLRNQGLVVETGEMSSVTWGPEDQMFAALKEAFLKSAERGPVVWVITLSNACPVPETA
ncbi:MAG: YkoF family thiamine/hydroxymethylpyrimidine-binding protein [candidate division NC10 bacterium]|nr:YkoF family thiamine/hydroxymethylpyrimidine-binding protein [candidate division NC10 bacterium]